MSTLSRKSLLEKAVFIFQLISWATHILTFIRKIKSIPNLSVHSHAQYRQWGFMMYCSHTLTTLRGDCVVAIQA